MQTTSLAVLLALVSNSDAIVLNKNGDEKKPEPDAYAYRQFGSMPSYWHDWKSDPFFANTWRFSGVSNGHVLSVTNDTAYTADAPTDYHFPTGTEQWEPDALLQLRESVRPTIGEMGMTAIPYEMEMIQTENTWNNKPWKEYLDPADKGYQWDQSSVNKMYRVGDSASYIKPYDQRDHSWSDAEYNQSDEVKFLDNTKTLHADYLENLDTSAEYHLREGRTGVAAADEV